MDDAGGGLIAPGEPWLEVEDWLRLLSVPGVGARQARRWVDTFGTPGRVLRASEGALRQAGLAPERIEALRRPDEAAVARALTWARQPRAHILLSGDPRFPPQLAAIGDPPAILFVHGDPALLTEPQIALVGSRNPSSGGVRVTERLARELAAHGLVVTSGLAQGIDGAAHRGALEAGRTVAVLGTGPDRVYPAHHRELAERIAATGALVSEFFPGQGPVAHHFPRRNRIISGLSLGVAVTEAAVRSGSLITARCALEQGREVFAVPGSILNPLARGCHALLRDGARLVEGSDDILDELAHCLRALLQREEPDAIRPAGGSPAGLDTLEAGQRALLEAMGFDPVAPDELIARTGLAPAAVAAMLLVLELEGHVSSLPGGRYSRLSP